MEKNEESRLLSLYMQRGRVIVEKSFGLRRLLEVSGAFLTGMDADYINDIPVEIVLYKDKSVGVYNAEEDCLLECWDAQFLQEKEIVFHILANEMELLLYIPAFTHEAILLPIPSKKHPSTGETVTKKNLLPMYRLSREIVRNMMFMGDQKGLVRYVFRYEK